MNLCVIGGKGRVGSAIVELAEEDGTVESVTVISSGDGNGTKVRGLMDGTDVVVIFCNDPAAAAQYALCAAELGINVVIGTTGLSDRHFEILEEAGGRVTVAWSSNFDERAQLFIHQVQYIVETLRGNELRFSAEVFEIHSVGKKDWPSATAYRLAEAICRGAELDYTAICVDNDAEVKPGEVVIKYQRTDDVKPFHRVTFHFEGGASTELRYESGGSKDYAEGALLAASQLAVRPKIPGLVCFDQLNIVATEPLS